MENIGTVVGIVVASIACILSLLAAVQANKRASVVEGRHLEEVVALKEKVCLMAATDTAIHEMAKDIREIKTDIKWLKGMKNAMDER